MPRYAYAVIVELDGPDENTAWETLTTLIPAIESIPTAEMLYQSSGFKLTDGHAHEGSTREASKLYTYDVAPPEPNYS